MDMLNFILLEQMSLKTGYCINYKAFDEVPANKLKSEVVQYIEGVQRIASLKLRSD